MEFSNAQAGGAREESPEFIQGALRHLDDGRYDATATDRVCGCFCVWNVCLLPHILVDERLTRNAPLFVLFEIDMNVTKLSASSTRTTRKNTAWHMNLPLIYSKKK